MPMWLIALPRLLHSLRSQRKAFLCKIYCVNSFKIYQPHYQALFDIINTQTWQTASIDQALNALDDIMFSMGDSYPHSTSDAILLMLDMLGFYLSLTAMEDKSAVSDGWVILTAEGYLDYYDQLAEDSSENTDDVAHSFDDWLAHPLTQTAFNHVNHALELAKRTCQK